MRLAADLPASGNRTEFVRARLVGDSLFPLVEQDSSALVALARADALIERPADAPAASAGNLVRAYWLENGGVA
jgi:molybdopterin molybdotransferase